MIKRLAILLGVLLLGLGVASAGLYWFLSGDGMRQALERQATAWLGQPVRIGAASASLLPRVAVRLENVTAGDPVRLTLAQVDLSTGLRALLSRRIEDAEVIVSGSRIEMPLPFGMPTESSAPAEPGAEAAAEPSGGGVEIASVRAITLRDVTIASRGREIALWADSSLEGSRLTLGSLSARSSNTVIDASGEVDLAPQVSATITANANELDFDDLLALAAAFTTDSAATGSAGAASGAGTANAQIKATITSPRARVADLSLARFSASLLANDAGVRVEPLQFDLFGGRFDGSVEASFDESLDIRIRAGVSNLDVAQLAAYGGSADTITGRLSGSGRFAARGRDIADVLATARGVGEVSMTSGTIRHLDVVRTVLLFFGRPGAEAPPAAGERYESITATFAIADGSVRSDDFTLRSPDFDVFARGTFGLATKALDARADLVVSEALSAQAGRDLYRYTRSGNRIVLPATIGGTLSAIQVRIDAGAAIRRGLQNEIERRLENLFERGR